MPSMNSSDKILAPVKAADVIGQSADWWVNEGRSRKNQPPRRYCGIYVLVFQCAHST